VEDALCRVSVVLLRGQESYCTLLDTWVLVDRDVVDYRSAITGLGAKSLRQKSRVDFATARAAVASLIAGKIVVGHALWNDFKVLKLHHPESDIRDTALYLKLRPPWRAHLLPSLNLLARCWLGDEACQAGVHDSVADATTALRIYGLHALEWEVAQWVFPIPMMTVGGTATAASMMMTSPCVVQTEEPAHKVEPTVSRADQAPAKSGGWPLGLLNHMEVPYASEDPVAAL
jgi:RNA exonuclease 4